MTNKIKGEKWARIKLPFRTANKTHIEVSNQGRVRSFNSLTDGKILKGGRMNGYPIQTFRFFKVRDAVAEKAFEVLENTIAKLELEKSATEEKIKAGKNKISASHKSHLKLCITLIKSLKNNLNDDKRKDKLKRRVNFNPLVHRLVAEYFCKKKSPENNIVIHLDHKKENNHFKNLKWVTQKEATVHQQKSRRVIIQNKLRKGRRSGDSKSFFLDVAKVAAIKKQIAGGKTGASVAKQFRISAMQVSRIKTGKNWADVKAAK